DIFFAPHHWEFGQDSGKMLSAAKGAGLFVAVLTMDALSGEKTRFLQEEMKSFRDSGPVQGRFCPILLDPIDSAQIAAAMPPGSPDAFWKAHEFYFYKDGTPLHLKPNQERYPGEYGMA